MTEFRTRVERYVLYKWATLLHSPYEMILVFILALISLKSHFLNLPDLLAGAVAFFHLHCLEALPESTHLEVFQAMLCGKRLESPDLHSLLSQSGLLHLFVVSGLHLNILSHVILKWAGLRKLSIIVLPVFALASGFQPPVVRALMHKAASMLSHKFEFFWKNELTVWHSAMLTLIFFPDWWLSYSFQLSWAALIGISISKNQHPMIQHLSIFLLMAPIISQFQGVKIVTILLTYLGSIVVGSFLFPAMILAVPFSFLLIIVDPLWTLVLSTLDLFRSELLASPPHTPTTRLTLLGYLILVHATLYLIRNWNLILKRSS